MAFKGRCALENRNLTRKWREAFGWTLLTKSVSLFTFPRTAWIWDSPKKEAGVQKRWNNSRMHLSWGVCSWTGVRKVVVVFFWRGGELIMKSTWWSLLMKLCLSLNFLLYIICMYFYTKRGTCVHECEGNTEKFFWSLFITAHDNPTWQCFNGW